MADEDVAGRVVYVVDADISGVAAGMQAAQQQVKQAAQTITADTQKIETAYDKLGETVAESSKENEKAAESAKKLGAETDKLGESQKKNAENTDKTAQYTKKLNERSEEAAKIQKKLNEDIDNVNRSLEKDAKSSELLTQKKKLLNKAVAETSNRLQELKTQQSEVSRAYLNNELPEEEYRDFQREIIVTEQALRSYQEQLDDVGKSHVDAAETLENFKDELAENAKTLAAIGGTVVAAVTAVGTKAITVANDIDKSAKKISSASGEGAASVEKFENVLKNVYSDNFGDSFEGIADDVSKITQNLGEMNEQTLTDITERAYTLLDVFDFGVDESSRAAKAMVQNFGISAEKAFDYITTGAQNGLNYSGELLDNISEYSVQFAKLGLSADDMFQIFEQGAANGAWNLDKIGDAIKEIAIRMVDGSKTTQEGFEAIGMDAETTAARIAQGSETAREAFIEVMNALAGMDDPIAQNEAGVNLLGTMWEDLGATAVEALAGISDEAYDCSGALDEIMKTNYNDLGNSFEALGRQVELALEPLGEELIPLITEFVEDIGADLKAELPEIVSEFSGLFELIVGGVKILWELRDVVEAGVVAFGTFKAACAIGNIINATVKAVQSFTSATKSAEAAQAAFNAVGAANPYVLIASLIAGVVSAVVSFISTAETATDRMERMHEEAKQLISDAEEYQEKSEGLKDVSDRYMDIYLSEKSAEEKGKELKNLQDELIDQYGAQAAGIDLVNGEYAEQLGLIDQLITKNKELAVANAQSALATVEEAEKELVGTGINNDYRGKNRAQITSFIKGLDSFEKVDFWSSEYMLGGTYEERAADLGKLYNYMVNDLGMSETDEAVKTVLSAWNNMTEKAEEKADLENTVAELTKEPEPEPFVTATAKEAERKGKAENTAKKNNTAVSSEKDVENEEEKTVTTTTKSASLPEGYSDKAAELSHKRTMGDITDEEYFSSMYALMSEYGIDGEGEYKKTFWAVQEDEKRYKDSLEKSDKSDSSSSTTSTSSTKTSNSSASKGNVISIDSYIPTMWDDAKTANEKLKAAVGIELAGNSSTAHVAGSGLEAITAAQPESTSAETAVAQTTEATLNDVVKLLTELRDGDTKRKISLDVDMHARDLAIGTIAIDDINDIAKMSGKNPFEFTE